MNTTTISPFDDIPASPPEINPEKQKEIVALSGYELERILREAANYVEKNKWAFYSDVEESVKYSLGYLLKTVEVAHDAHKKAMTEHYERLYDTWTECDKKHTDLIAKVKGLPQIKFPEVPYFNTDNFQRLFDMAEKLSKLDDNQWGRLTELAEALKTK
jgi:hypothetical protein